jgi:hypothetical protein
LVLACIRTLSYDRGDSALDGFSSSIPQVVNAVAARTTMEAAQPAPGSLSWRLSSHPITLLTFLGFRVCEFSPVHGVEGLLSRQLTILPASLLVYLFGLIFTDNMYEYPIAPLIALISYSEPLYLDES